MSRRVPLSVRRRRWVALVAVVIIAAVSGSVWWFRAGNRSAANNPSYRLVSATTTTLRQTVTSSGTIAPAQQDSVNFTVSGTVTRVAVTAGQRVSAGAVLATIDTATLAADLAQAKATLATAQAKLSSDDADTSTTSEQRAADAAAATSAQGQVSAAQRAMSAATLTSPITGVVAAVNVVAGQQVSGSATTSAGAGSSAGSSGGTGSGSGTGTGSGTASTTTSAQFLVISTSSWIVNATVDATGVGLIAVGNQAQIVPGSSTSTVYGTISSVGLIASSTSGVATFPVVIAVTGSPSGLHAGDTATVSLIYRQLTDVLTVPTAAVHTVNGKQVVYEMSGGTQVAHPVQVGLSWGGSTQITSGLSEGDQVVERVAAAPSGVRSGTNRSGRPSGGYGQFPGSGQFPGGGAGGGGGAPGGGAPAGGAPAGGAPGGAPGNGGG